MGNNCLKQLSFGADSLFFPVVPVVSNLKPHLRNSPSGFLIMGNNCLKQLSFGADSLFFPVVPVVSNLKPHLRNSPSRFLMTGNNCLKQLSFGARARGLAAPLYRPPSAATLCRRIRFAVHVSRSMLFFFSVVPVVSNLKPHG